MKITSKVLGIFVAGLFASNVALASINDIDIDQVGSDNDSVTSQNGDGNHIEVDQDSHVTTSGKNDSKVIQAGDSNVVDVLQDTDATSGAITNKVDIDQSGGTNKVRGTSGSNIGSLAIDTAGSSTANQSSTKRGNELIVDQDNGGNDIGLYQEASAGDNEANFVQKGSDNVATRQISTGIAGTDDNKVDVDQLGTSTNDAFNFQSGSGNNTFKLNQTN